MAKKNKFKRNKSDIPSNIFDGGGIITNMYTQNISGPKLSQSGLPSSYQTGMKYGNMGNTSNVGSNLMSSLGNTALGMGAGIVGNLGGNLIAGGKQSGIGSTIGSLGNTIGSAAMMVNPLVGGAIMGGTSLLGGVFNAIGGVKLNKNRIAQAENEINAVKNFNEVFPLLRPLFISVAPALTAPVPNPVFLPAANKVSTVSNPIPAAAPYTGANEEFPIKQLTHQQLLIIGIITYFS